MNKVTKKSTKLAIKISAVVFSVLMVAIASIGIYFGTRKKPAAPTIVNPIDFAIDTWDGKTSSATDWNKGKDYAKRGDKTYTIDSAESFIHFVKLVNNEAEAAEYDYFRGYTVYLNNGIDLGGNQIDAIGRKLTDGSSTFQGTFDGGFYTIYNGTIKGNGLFGYVAPAVQTGITSIGAVENPTIKNIGLYNITINGNSEYVGGIVGTAVNTNISSTYVRLGTINGPKNVGGIVGNFVSSNGEHYIEKSFEDTTLAGKTNYGIAANIDANSSTENRVTISNSYYVTANKSYNSSISGFVADGSFKATNINDFSTLDYGKYSENKTWCDYSFIENSRELTFNYPILTKFNKVFNTGSFYEGVTYNETTGEAISTSDIKTAFEMIESNQSGEVNIIVEKVFMEETAVAASGATVKVDALTPTVIERGASNQDSFIVGAAGSSLTIGNDEEDANPIVFDGNREYVEENNLQSGPAIASTSYDFILGDNVLITDNINNTTGMGGGLSLAFPYKESYSSTDEISAIDLTGLYISNCSATGNGGGAYISGTFGTLNEEIGVAIQGCHADGNGGGLYINTGYEPSAQNLVSSMQTKYGSNTVINQTRISYDGVKYNVTLYNGAQNVDFKSSLNNVDIPSGGISGSCTGDGGALWLDMNNYSLYLGSSSGQISISGTASGSGGGARILNSTITIYNCYVYSSNANGGNGGGLCLTYCTSTVTNTLSIYNNFCSGGGGGLYVDSGSFNTNMNTTTTINNNTANGSGGGYIHAGGSAEVYKLSVAYNTAKTHGGGIALTAGSLQFYGSGTNASTISNNHASQCGGGLDRTGSTTLILTTGHVNFTSNTADTYGGGIRSTSGLAVSGESFTSNTAGTSGGAVVADAASTYNSCTFNSNYSRGDTGAVLTHGGATYTSCTFTNNHCVTYAGALAARNGTTKVDSCTFTGNYTDGWNNSSSNDQACGAIDANGTTITIKNSTFTQNKSWRYGAVVCLNGSLTFEGTNTFTENQAGVQYGGALGVETNGTINSPDGVVLKFYRNSAAGEGGAIRSGVTGTTGPLTLHDAVFEGNSAGSHGGAIANNVAISIYDSTFTSNTTGGCGAGLCTWASGTIVRSTFTSNTSADGGAVHFSHSNGVNNTVSGCTFTSNTGGALNIYDNVARTTNVDWSYFYGNTRGGSGGAIVIDNTSDSINVSNCIFGDETRGNSTSNAGGAIFFRGVKLSISNSTFTGNTADLHGGAIYNATNDMSIESCTFNLNKGINYGGGAISSDGSLIVSSSTFISNEACGTNGGAIATANKLVLSNSIFTTNKAYEGGGAIALLRGSSFEYGASDTGNTFTGNEAQQYGGAILIVGETAYTFDLTNVIMANNKAVTVGGAVYMVDVSEDLSAAHVLNVNTGYYYGNEAEKAGAFSSNTGHFTLNIGTHANSTNDNLIIGGYYNDSDELVVSGNKATGTTSAAIGGVYVHATSSNSKETVTITNGTFIGNSAYQAGVLQINGRSSTLKSTLTINGGIFKQNTATIYGGAFRTTGSANTTVISGNAQFIENSVTNGYGGAISANTTLTVTSATFKENSSKSGGGAIYASTTLTLGTSGCAADAVMFKGNTAAYGGAIYANYSTIYNATFDSNKSTGSTYGGSAIAHIGTTTSTSTRTIHNITLTNNEAKIGGAIHIRGNVTYNITNITASGNKGANGAVISTESYLYSSTSTYYYPTINITGTASFSDNEATGNGGAIHVISGATLNITNATGNVTFSGNTAAGNGGAIYNAGTFTTSDSNTYSTSLTNNEATGSGGAVYVNTGATTSITNATFSGNSVADSYDDMSKGNGGAIYSAGTLTITDSTFSNNASGDASGNGGGAIYVASNSTLDIQSALFENNTADEGGALYLASDSTITTFNAYGSGNTATVGGFVVNSTELTINNTSDRDIYNNTASYYGGAIYNGETLNWHGGAIYGNKLEDYGYGSAIYNDGGTVSFGGNFVDSDGNLDRYAIYSALTNTTVTADTIIDDIPAANFNASPVTYGIATLKVNMYDGFYDYGAGDPHQIVEETYKTTHEINLFDISEIHFDEAEGYIIRPVMLNEFNETFVLTDTSSTTNRKLADIVNDGSFVYSFYSLSDSSKLNTTTSFSEEIENLNLFVYYKQWTFIAQNEYLGADQYYSNVSSATNVFSYEANPSFYSDSTLWNVTSERGHSLLAWNTTADLTIDIEQGDSISSALSTPTYYSVWGASETVSVNHTFNLSATEIQTKSTSYSRNELYNYDYSIADDDTIKYDDDLTLPTQAELTYVPEGYYLYGWSISDDSSTKGADSTKEYEPGETIDVNGAMTFYAVWAKEYVPDGARSKYTHTFYYYEQILDEDQHLEITKEIIETSTGLIPEITAYNYKLENPRKVQVYSENGEPENLIFPNGSNLGINNEAVYWATSADARSWLYREDDEVIPHSDTVWYAIIGGDESTWTTTVRYWVGEDEYFTGECEIYGYQLTNYAGDSWVISINDEIEYIEFPDASDYAPTDTEFMGWTTDPNGYEVAYYEGDSESGISVVLDYYAVWRTTTDNYHWQDFTVTVSDYTGTYELWEHSTEWYIGSNVYCNYSMQVFEEYGDMRNENYQTAPYPSANTPEGFEFAYWSEYEVDEEIYYNGALSALQNNMYAVYKTTNKLPIANEFVYDSNRSSFIKYYLQEPDGDVSPVWYNYDLSYATSGEYTWYEGSLDRPWTMTFPTEEEVRKHMSSNQYEGYYLAGWTDEKSNVFYRAGETATVQGDDLGYWDAVWAKKPTDDLEEISQKEFVFHVDEETQINQYAVGLHNAIFVNAETNNEYVEVVDGLTPAYFGAGTFPTATKEGYTFMGWTSDSSGTQPEKYAGDTVNVNGAEDWYAVWSNYSSSATLTVKFWINATDYKTASTTTHFMSTVLLYYSYDLSNIWYDSNIYVDGIDYIEELTAPGCDESDFVGWSEYERGALGFYENNGYFDDVEIYQEGDTIETPQANYYAVYYYTADSEQELTHTFRTGASVSFTATSSISYNTIPYGYANYTYEYIYYETEGTIDSYNPLTMPMPESQYVPNEYGFVGWATDSSSRESYYPGNVVELDQPTTFYAVYGDITDRSNATHTFYVTSSRTDSVTNELLAVETYYNYIGEEIGTDNAQLKAFLKLPEPSTIPNGYTFAGWSTGYDNVPEYEAGQTITVIGPSNFYAVWKSENEARDTYFNVYNNRINIEFDAFSAYCYDLTGGSVVSKVTMPDTATVISLGGSDSVPDCIDCGHTKLSLKGWTTNPFSYTVEFEPGDTLYIGSNTEFYAVWIDDTDTQHYAESPYLVTFRGWTSDTTYVYDQYLGMLNHRNATNISYSYNLHFGDYPLQVLSSVAGEIMDGYYDGVYLEVSEDDLSEGLKLAGWSADPASITLVNKVEEEGVSIEAIFAENGYYTYPNLDFYAVWEFDIATYDFEGETKFTYNLSESESMTESREVTYWIEPDDTATKLYFNYNFAIVDSKGGTYHASAPSMTLLTQNDLTYTPNGYSLVGWSTEPDATVEYAPGATLTDASVNALYAVWGNKLSSVPVEHTLHYAIDGNTVNTYTVTSYYTGTANVQWSYNLSENIIADGSSGTYSLLTLPSSSEIGIGTIYDSSSDASYSLSGWTLNSTSTSATYGDGATISVDGPKDFYAVWSSLSGFDASFTFYDIWQYDTDNSYTEYFGGGTYANYNLSITDSYYDMVMPQPEHESPFGLTFAGWTTDPNGTTPEYLARHSYDIESGSLDTFYAVWKWDSNTHYEINMLMHTGIGESISNAPEGWEVWEYYPSTCATVTGYYSWDMTNASIDLQNSCGYCNLLYGQFTSLDPSLTDFYGWTDDCSSIENKYLDGSNFITVTDSEATLMLHGIKEITQDYFWVSGKFYYGSGSSDYDYSGNELWQSSSYIQSCDGSVKQALDGGYIGKTVSYYAPECSTVPDGYTFAGWSREQVPTSLDNLVQPDDEIVVTITEDYENDKFYAVFVKGSTLGTINHTIYDFFNGTQTVQSAVTYDKVIGTGYYNYVLEELPFTADSGDATITSYGKLTLPAGYTYTYDTDNGDWIVKLVGWTTDPNGYKIEAECGAEVEVNGTTTWYAVYEANGTSQPNSEYGEEITFQSDGSIAYLHTFHITDIYSETGLSRSYEADNSFYFNYNFKYVQLKDLNSSITEDVNGFTLSENLVNNITSKYEGYTLVGFTTDATNPTPTYQASYDGEYWYVEVPSSFASKGSTNFYAVWSKDTGETTTYTFWTSFKDSQTMEVSGSALYNYLLDEETATISSTDVFPSYQKPSTYNADASIIGWTTNPSSYEAQFECGDTITSAATTWYAVYQHNESEGFIVTIYLTPDEVYQFMSPNLGAFTYYNYNFKQSSFPTSNSNLSEIYNYPSVSEISIPTSREGYVLQGFNTSASGYEANFNFESPQGNIPVCVYAVWQEGDYYYFHYSDDRVDSYKANVRNCSYDLENKGEWEFYNEVYWPSNMDDYSLVGWTSDPNSYSYEYEASDTPDYVSSSSKHWYAVWNLSGVNIDATVDVEFMALQSAGSFTVTCEASRYVSEGYFNYNLTIGDYSSSYIEYSSMVAPEPNATPDGYTFAGWSSDYGMDGYHSDGTMPGGTLYPSSESYSTYDFYGIWKKVTDTNTEVKFYTGTDTYITDYLQSVGYYNYELSYASYEDMDCISFPEATKAGYTLAGWTNDPTSTTTMYTAGQSISEYGGDFDLTWYAVWSITPTGGEVAIPNKFYISEDEYIIGYGYKDVEFVSNRTMYYNYNLTEVRFADSSISTVTDVNLPTLDSSKYPTGYTLYGWTADSVLTSTSEIIGKDDGYTYGNENHTFYAVWEKEDASSIEYKFYIAEDEYFTQNYNGTAYYGYNLDPANTLISSVSGTFPTATAPEITVYDIDGNVNGERSLDFSNWTASPESKEYNSSTTSGKTLSTTSTSWYAVWVVNHELLKCYVSEDVTQYVTYGAAGNIYYANYNLSNRDCSATATISMPGLFVGKPTTDEYRDCTFVGWSNSSTGTSEYDGPELTVSENLYAVWSQDDVYRFHYSADCVVENKAYERTTNYNLTEGEWNFYNEVYWPTYEGYDYQPYGEAFTIVGWSIDGSTDIYHYVSDDGHGYVSSSYKDFYAVWEANGDTTVELEISFYETSDSDPQILTTEAGAYAEGSFNYDLSLGGSFEVYETTVTAPQPSTIPEGYEFVCWMSEANPSMLTGCVAAGGEFSSASTNWYAIWKKLENVSTEDVMFYVGEDDWFSTKLQQYSYFNYELTKLTLTEDADELDDNFYLTMPTATKDGYTLAGWTPMESSYRAIVTAGTQVSSNNAIHDEAVDNYYYINEVSRWYAVWQAETNQGTIEHEFMDYDYTTRYVESVVTYTQSYTKMYNYNLSYGQFVDMSDKAIASYSAFNMPNCYVIPDGYEFHGWSATKDSYATVYGAGNSYTPTGETSWYAIYKQDYSETETITHTFYTNTDTSISANSSKTDIGIKYYDIDCAEIGGVNTNTTYSQLTLPSATRAGYTLVGWVEGEAGKTATSASLTAGDEVDVSGETEWYAVWSGDLVTSTNNSGEVSAYGDTITLSFETGDGNSVADITAYRNTYYTYNTGYYSQNHNYNLTYHSGSETSVVVDDYYRLVNNGTEGSWATSIPELVLTTTTLPSATLSGYEFVGWSTANDTTSEYTTGSSFTATANTTLYAVWSQEYKEADTDATYTHTFNVFDGKLDDITTDVTVKYTTGTKYFSYNTEDKRVVNESVVDKDQYVRDELIFPTATRAGYELAGWSDGNNETVDYTTVAYTSGDHDYIPEGNTTWYAVWKKTFNFYDTSATVNKVEQTYAYNSTAKTTTKPNPTLTGFEFVGYAVEGESALGFEFNWTTPTFTTTTISTDSAEQNFFAVWKRTISVTPSYEDGSTITGNTVSLVVYNTVVNAAEGTIVASDTYTVNTTTNYYGAVVEINADVKEDAESGNYQLVKVFLDESETPVLVTSRDLINDRSVQALQGIQANATIEIVYADAYKLDIDMGTGSGAITIEPPVNDHDIRDGETDGEKEVIVNNSNEVDLTLKVYEDLLTSETSAFFGFYVSDGKETTYVPTDSIEQPITYEKSGTDTIGDYKQYTVAQKYAGAVQVIVKTPVVALEAVNIQGQTFKIKSTTEGFYKEVNANGKVSLYNGTWEITQETGTTVDLATLKTIFTGVEITQVDGKFIFTLN